MLFIFSIFFFFSIFFLLFFSIFFFYFLEFFFLFSLLFPLVSYFFFFLSPAHLSLCVFFLEFFSLILSSLSISLHSSSWIFLIIFSLLLFFYQNIFFFFLLSFVLFCVARFSVFCPLVLHNFLLFAFSFTPFTLIHSHLLLLFFFFFLLLVISCRFFIYWTISSIFPLSHIISSTFTFALFQSSSKLLSQSRMFIFSSRIFLSLLSSSFSLYTTSTIFLSHLYIFWSYVQVKGTCLPISPYFLISSQSSPFPLHLIFFAFSSLFSSLCPPACCNL